MKWRVMAWIKLDSTNEVGGIELEQSDDRKVAFAKLQQSIRIGSMHLLMVLFYWQISVCDKLSWNQIKPTFSDWNFKQALNSFTDINFKRASFENFANTLKSVRSKWDK